MKTDLLMPLIKAINAAYAADHITSLEDIDCVHTVTNTSGTDRHLAVVAKNRTFVSTIKAEDQQNIPGWVIQQLLQDRGVDNIGAETSLLDYCAKNLAEWPEKAGFIYQDDDTEPRFSYADPRGGVDDSRISSGYFKSSKNRNYPAKFYGQSVTEYQWQQGVARLKHLKQCKLLVI